MHHTIFAFPVIFARQLAVTRLVCTAPQVRVRSLNAVFPGSCPRCGHEAATRQGVSSQQPIDSRGQCIM